MLSGSPWQLIDYPKINTTSEMVKETLEMLGIDFSDFATVKSVEIVKIEAKIHHFCATG